MSVAVTHPAVEDWHNLLEGDGAVLSQEEDFILLKGEAAPIVRPRPAAARVAGNRALGDFVAGVKRDVRLEASTKYSSLRPA